MGLALTLPIRSRLLVALAVLAGLLALGLSAHLSAPPAGAAQGLSTGSIIRITSPRFT